MHLLLILIFTGSSAIAVPVKKLCIIENCIVDCIASREEMEFGARGLQTCNKLFFPQGLQKRFLNSNKYDILYCLAEYRRTRPNRGV